MPEIISKDSRLYSRYLIGKARHITFQARQKELKPYHISPRQANTLIIVYKLGGKEQLPPNWLKIPIGESTPFLFK